jgi:hypothetical protein
MKMREIEDIFIRDEEKSEKFRGKFLEIAIFWRGRGGIAPPPHQTLSTFPTPTFFVLRKL